MSGFIASSGLYNVCPENEITVMMSHFSTDYIFDIIKDNIESQYTCYKLGTIPNIVSSFEQYFKYCLTMYTSDEDVKKIHETRNETYSEIIRIICQYFNFYFNANQEDLFTAAFNLYDFFISNFTNNVVTFFSKYIIKEKNALYDLMNLSESKRSKDTSTIYNKKLYKNTKLAIINANLESVLDNIMTFDISFETILTILFQDKNLIKYMSTLIQPCTDFFKTVYLPLLQSHLKPIIITNIRLEIQKLSVDQNVNILNFK